jgi:hypothetical protein
MLELPPLTPERFEILVVRELRKVGLEVSELHIHRRTTLPEPQHGYLLELAGAVSRPPWRRRVLIACRRQDAPIGRVEVDSLWDHLQEAGTDAGILFATTTFDRDALQAAQECAFVLLRVTDGRTAFDTSGWGTPGHYPAWLPAYCAQAVSRDPMGQPFYRLLEEGQGDAIVQRLHTEVDRARAKPVEPGGPPREASPAG